MRGLLKYFDETFVSLNMDMGKYEIKEASFNGVEIRLIDPATMLVYDETDSLQLSFTVDSEDEGVLSMSHEQNKDYDFEYIDKSE